MPPCTPIRPAAVKNSDSRVRGCRSEPPIHLARTEDVPPFRIHIQRCFLDRQPVYVKSCPSRRNIARLPESRGQKFPAPPFPLPRNPCPERGRTNHASS